MGGRNLCCGFLSQPYPEVHRSMQKFLHLRSLGFTLLFFIVSFQTQTIPVIPNVKPEMPSLPSLFSQLKARQSSIRDIKSFLNTKVSGEYINYSFRQALLVRGEEAIRVDTYNLFRQVLGVLIYEGGKTLMYYPRSNRVVYEEKIRDTMRQVMGTHIDLREYISVFSGGIPRLPYLQARAAEWNSDQTIYRIEAVDQETGEQVDIDIDAYTMLPKSMSLTRGVKEIYRVYWDDYQNVDQWNFAHKVTIEHEGKNDAVIMEYIDPAINQGIDPSAFQLAPALKNR